MAFATMAASAAFLATGSTLAGAAAGVSTAAAVGAGLGAAGSAISGGDVGEGALMGAGTGALTFGAGSALAPAAAPAAQAVTTGAGSALAPAAAPTAQAATTGLTQGAKQAGIAGLSRTGVGLAAGEDIEQAGIAGLTAAGASGVMSGLGKFAGDAGFNPGDGSITGGVPDGTGVVPDVVPDVSGIGAVPEINLDAAIQAQYGGGAFDIGGVNDLSGGLAAPDVSSVASTPIPGGEASLPPHLQGSTDLGSKGVFPDNWVADNALGSDVGESGVFTGADYSQAGDQVVVDPSATPTTYGRNPFDIDADYVSPWDDTTAGAMQSHLKEGMKVTGTPPPVAGSVGDQLGRIGAERAAAMNQQWTQGAEGSKDASLSNIARNLNTGDKLWDAGNYMMPEAMALGGGAALQGGYDARKAAEAEGSDFEANKEAKRQSYWDTVNAINASYGRLGRKPPTSPGGGNWASGPGFAQGGAIGRYIQGRGTGESDSIPAVVDGREPARISTGEFVVPAQTVQAAGGPNSFASVLDRITKARGMKGQAKSVSAQPVLVSSVAEEWQARRMKIQPVLTTSVAQVWPSVEKHIVSALEYSKGDYNAEHAKVYLSRGDWNLFVATNKSNVIKGAAIIEYINRPNDRVAFMIAIGGRLITSADTFSQFKDLLKFDGATKLEGAARESVARLWMSRFGCTEKYRIVEVSL